MLNKSLFVSLVICLFGLSVFAQEKLDRPYKDLSSQDLVNQLKETYLVLHQTLNRVGKKSASKEVVGEVNGAATSDNYKMFSESFALSSFSGKFYQLTGGDVWEIKVIDTDRMSQLVDQLKGDNDGTKVVYTEAIDVSNNYQGLLYNAKSQGGAISLGDFGTQIQAPIDNLRNMINEVKMRGKSAFSNEQITDIVGYVGASATTKIEPTIYQAPGNAYEGYVDASHKQRHYGYFLQGEGGNRTYTCRQDNQGEQGLPTNYKCAGGDGDTSQSINDQFLNSYSPNPEYLF